MARRKKNKSYTMNSGMKTLIQKAGYMTYGALRPSLSNALNRLPAIQKANKAFELTDEAILLALNKGSRMMGLGKTPYVKDILKGQDAIEWARVGDWGRVQFLNRTNNRTASSNSSNEFSFR